jgi:hypothetical protein
VVKDYTSFWQNNARPAPPAKTEESFGARAIKAAEAVTMPVGVQKTRQGNAGLVTIEDAAKQFDVGRDAVVSAKFLLKHGTEYQIERVRSGKDAIHPMVKHIKQQRPETRGRAHTPAAVEQRRLKALVWNQMRAALEGLASLPSARDCVDVAQTADRNDFIRKQLPKATAWLGAFEQEWKSRR